MRLATATIFLLIFALRSPQVRGFGRKDCHKFNSVDYGAHSSEKCGSGRCWSAVTLSGWYLGGCNSFSTGCSTEFFEEKAAAKGGLNKKTIKCCDESWCNGIDEKWRKKKDSDKELGEKTPKPPSSPFEDKAKDKAADKAASQGVRTFCAGVHLLLLAMYCVIVF